MSDGEPVTRSSFGSRLQPISVRWPLAVLPSRVWSAEDWERIKLGYKSWDMDAKWDIFVEGDVAFLHRSWTGRGVYEATFAPAASGGRRITEAVVERDPERYRNDDDEYDRVMLELVISAIVLDEPTQELRAEVARLAGDGYSPEAVLHSSLGVRPPDQPG